MICESRSGVGLNLEIGRRGGSFLAGINRQSFWRRYGEDLGRRLSLPYLFGGVTSIFSVKMRPRSVHEADLKRSVFVCFYPEVFSVYILAGLTLGNI